MSQAATITALDSKTPAVQPSTIMDEKTVTQVIYTQLTNCIVAAVQNAYPTLDMTGVSKDAVHAAFSKIEAEGRVAFPVFIIAQKLKALPNGETNLPKIGQALAKSIEKQPKIDELLAKVVAERQFVNLYLSNTVLSQVVADILTGSFLQSRRSERNKERVMIEYSQPNTHKAFHVGHMRNAALGDSLVRIYEAMGHPVVAANYFGDEGAHIAKCLWQLQKYIAENKFDLKTVPESERGEWLGGFYSKAVDLLSLSGLTKYPFENVIAAKVTDMSPHPAKDAPKTWSVVKLQVKPDIQSADAFQTVVCGGHSYKVGDTVAYLPVGSPHQEGKVSVKDMKGVASAGIIMSEKELEVESDDVDEAEVILSAPTAVDAAGTKDAKDSKDDKKAVKKDEKKKKAEKKSPSTKIYVVPAAAAAPMVLGTPLTEAGRLPNVGIEAGCTVMEEWTKRNKQVSDMLVAIEHGEPAVTRLLEETRGWSMTEFKKIYKWLDCRFDHDFFESEVAEESKQLVIEQEKKGVLKKNNGAIMADLNPYKLGWLVLLKSNGAGLYATKDLALARRKFDQFKIDQSIYIVDAAQTLHFKQVFKVLEMFGYPNAHKCFHLPYGQVILPSGKMSSRKGTVIYFSTLTKMLGQQIDADYLKRYEGKWSEQELANARQMISVATIKFGMLNHDTSKDIVFKMEDWTAHSGMTGPYMLYAYARGQSILREVVPSSEAKVDYALLKHDSERVTLSMMWNFWNVVAACIAKKNPSALCEYLYNLAKSYSSWYESVSVKNAESIHIQATRLAFIRAFCAVLKRGLSLLGIQTIDRM